MPTPAEILKAAQALPARGGLEPHREAIESLRDKGLSWREIADFLCQHGLATDHTKVYRFMKDGAGGFTVPSADDYARALQEISISDDQRKMLAYHFHAHNRTVTYTELAQAAGQPDHQYANRWYGELGKTLGTSLGVEFYKYGEKVFYSSALGTENTFRAKKTHYELMMHHELAKALDKLGWFARHRQHPDKERQR